MPKQRPNPSRPSPHRRRKTDRIIPKKKDKRKHRVSCPIAKDLRTPKYRPRVVADKKKKLSREQCRKGAPKAPFSLGHENGLSIEGTRPA